MIHPALAAPAKLPDPAGSRDSGGEMSPDNIIRKQIFPTLDRQRSYQLLRPISVLTWTVALAGIGAWVWVESRPADMEPPRREVNADIRAEQSVVGLDEVNVGTINIGVRNEPSAAKEQPSD